MSRFTIGEKEELHTESDPMKVRPSVKKMCGKCKIVSRSKKGKSKRLSAKKRLFVICDTPKHKQRQG